MSPPPQSRKQVGVGLSQRKTSSDPKVNVESEEFQNATAQELSEIFAWVDQVPLSRPKRNINRDFSDGVLYAELVAAYFPKLVDIHNYVAASSVAQKKNNWSTLNKKVLTKIGIKLTAEDIMELSQAKVGAIEMALKQLCHKVNSCLIEKEKKMAAQVAAARGDGNDGDNPNAGSTREVICLADGNPESGLTYQGIKMIPAYVVEQMDHKINELEKETKELGVKVQRQETLLVLKEERLTDLTARINDLKAQNEKLKEESAAQIRFKLNKWTDPTGLV